MVNCHLNLEIKIIRLTKLDTNLETKKLFISKMVLLLINFLKIIFKLVSKLVT